MAVTQVPVCKKIFPLSVYEDERLQVESLLRYINKYNIVFGWSISELCPHSCSLATSQRETGFSQ